MSLSKMLNYPDIYFQKNEKNTEYFCNMLLKSKNKLYPLIKEK